MENTLTIQEAKKQIELIRAIWRELDYTFQSIGWGQYGKQYLKMNVDEEKDHRRFNPENIRCFLSVQESAELFSVRQLVEYIFTDAAPDPKGFHCCRKSIYMAYSLAKTYEKEIKIALGRVKGFNVQEVLNINYADLQALGY